jgi:hypothetical protein
MGTLGGSKENIPLSAGVYGGEKRGLVGYVDADGASQEHRCAISGYVFLVDGGAVSWSSKKQELIMLSTTEAKYVAATHA